MVHVTTNDANDVRKPSFTAVIASSCSSLTNPVRVGSGIKVLLKAIKSEKLTGININNGAINCGISDNTDRAGNAENAPYETDYYSNYLTTPVDYIEKFILFRINIVKKHR